MDFGNLYNYLFMHLGIYIIGGYAVVKVVKGISDGSMGEIVKAIVIASFAYWFGKNPGAALGQIAAIWDKVKSIGR